jgi:hypothetical protein
VFVVQATQDIDASTEEVLGFVMDVDRYSQADRKIRRIRRLERHGDETVAAMWTRVRGVPAPATQRLRLTPGQRIDVTNEPSWQDQLVEFHGEFTCTPAEAGVRVTHRYSFDFKGPGKIVEPLLPKWMAQDIEAEVDRMRTVLESNRRESSR